MSPALFPTQLEHGDNLNFATNQECSRLKGDSATSSNPRFETFGTVYGLAMTLSGLFGLILTPLDIFTKNQLRGNYTPVNITLLLFGLVTALGLGLRVWLYTREGGSGGGSGRVRLEGEDGDGLEGLISGISRISGAIREEEEEEA